MQPRARSPPMETPVIGAINGVAITGGFELALACDFLIASERARFADTHARVGIMPGWGLTVLLPEAVGLPARQGAVDHRELPRRRHRAVVGARQPRRAPRGAAARLPPARSRHRHRRAARASGACCRPTTTGRSATVPERGPSRPRSPAPGRVPGSIPTRSSATARPWWPEVGPSSDADGAHARGAAPGTEGAPPRPPRRRSATRRR